MKKILRRVFLSLFLFGIFGMFLPQIVVWHFSKNRIFPLSRIPEKTVALVFGASVIENRFPSPVLADRISTAAELYFQGKVQKLLLTGDNSEQNYNEVQVMKNTMRGFGVPESAIVLDYAGFRTYDSCIRAREIFGVREAILVTQRFHLPRALYLCEQFGIDVHGVAADKRSYEQITFLRWREFLARIGAFFEATLFRHEPKFLGEKVEMFKK